MNKEKETELVNKYPKILRDYGKNPMETCMAWGFECEDGWAEILDNCMKKVQCLCDVFSTEENNVQVVADQIKEKYGTLSFYYSIYGATDPTVYEILRDTIDQVERKSCTVCEVTGKRGKVCNRGGWYKTLCKEEAEKLNYTYPEK
jgi:hypothetical protein